MIEETLTPTPEQITRGYSGQFVMDNNGRMAWVYRNNAHDPITRWENAGRLTPSNITVIDTMRRIWFLVGLHQNVTANYGERISGQPSAEFQIINKIKAAKDLKRIEGYIPKKYWTMFERVCRHGWAAGVAGSDLGFGGRSAQDRAHMVVVIVCDVIGINENLSPLTDGRAYNIRYG